MKHLILIVAVALFIGCEKTAPSQPHPILGDWRVQSCQVSEYADDALVSDYFTDYSQRNEIIRFIDGGMGVWIHDNIVYKWFSWEIDNQNLLIVEDIGEPLNYKINMEADIFLYIRESVYNTDLTRNRVVFSYIAYRVN